MYVSTNSDIEEDKDSSSDDISSRCNYHDPDQKWESFRELLCEIQSDNFCFVYTGVSEVFKCDDDHRPKLPGFHDTLTQCRTDGFRGRVKRFIKASINFKLPYHLSVFILHAYESLIIEIISKSVINCIVEIIYRPNTPSRANINIILHTYLIP